MLRWAGWILIAQLIAAIAANWLTSGLERAMLTLFLVPLATMIIIVRSSPSGQTAGPWPMLKAIVVATMASLSAIYVWQRLVDPASFLGPVPASLIPMAMAGMGVIIFVSSGSVAVCFAARQTGLRRRIRWPVFITAASLLVLIGFALKLSVREMSPATLAEQVMQLEQSIDTDAAAKQQLSTLLAMLGRDQEAEAASAWIVSGERSAAAKPTAPPRDFDVRAQDWRTTIADIAAKNRIVIIMESHNAPKHREWIEQTLSTFREAGFAIYAAEGLGESGSALKQRGYPITSTGYYTNDPRFGNLLRKAIELGFEIREYDSFPRDAQQREQDQARALAAVFSSHPTTRLLVHAGHAHVFKRSLPGYRTMATLLWEVTGVEPYCILQTYDEPEAHDYRRLVQSIGPIDEPVMLTPMPAGLTDRQFFAVPEGAVDALVVHPLTVAKTPADREPVFDIGLTKLSCRWLGDDWPVVIGVYKPGEPNNAVALDQVMLREGERPFALWTPVNEYELRVFDQRGPMETVLVGDSDRIEIRAIDPR